MGSSHSTENVQTRSRRPRGARSTPLQQHSHLPQVQTNTANPQEQYLTPHTGDASANFAPGYPLQPPHQGPSLHNLNDPGTINQNHFNPETASQKEERLKERRRKAELNKERRRLKQEKQRERAEAKQREIERQARAKQEWKKQKEKESRRTRTHPATSKVPFPGPENLRARTEEQNTYYSAKWRTDFDNNEQSGTYSRQNRTLTKADVLRDLASAPPPSADERDNYPHVYRDYDKLYPASPSELYSEYPIKGSEHIPHTFGHDFDWADSDGRHTGPWRAVTNMNKDLVGVIAHNHPKGPQPGGFQKAKQNYLGPPQPVRRAEQPRRRRTRE